LGSSQSLQVRPDAVGVPLSAAAAAAEDNAVAARLLLAPPTLLPSPPLPLVMSATSPITEAVDGTVVAELRGAKVEAPCCVGLQLAASTPTGTLLVMCCWLISAAVALAAAVELAVPGGPAAPPAAAAAAGKGSKAAVASAKGQRQSQQQPPASATVADAAAAATSRQQQQRSAQAKWEKQQQQRRARLEKLLKRGKRVGQRMRRQLYEKLYGGKANHLQVRSLQQAPRGWQWSLRRCGSCGRYIWSMTCPSRYFNQLDELFHSAVLRTAVMLWSVLLQAVAPAAHFPCCTDGC